MRINKTSKATKAIMILAIACVGFVALPSQAQADSNAACEIFEIRASNEAGGIDPALSGMSKKLKKPPFSSYKTYKLLKKHNKSVVKMTQLKLALVTGGSLGLLFRERVKAPGKKDRLRLSVTLDNKKGKRMSQATVNLDVGDHLVLGGEPLGGGATYVLATSCK